MSADSRLPAPPLAPRIERRPTYAEALGHGRLGLWQWDVAARRMVWSDDFYRILALDPGSVPASAEALLAHVHPDDRARVAYHLSDAPRTDQPFSFDHRIVQPGGGVRRLQARGLALHDGAGRLVRLVAAVYDLTPEALPPSRGLARQLDRQATLLDLQQRVLAGLDAAAVMERAAAAVAAALDVPFTDVYEMLPGEQTLVLRAGWGWPEGVVGRLTVTASPESQPGYALASQAVIVSPNLAAETRFRALPIKQRLGVVSGISVPIRGRGAARGVLGAHTTSPRTFGADDVDFLQAAAQLLGVALERQHTEQALRSSRDQLSVILKGAADGVLAHTSGGRLVYANVAAARLLGFASAEALIGAAPDEVQARTLVLNEAGQPLDPVARPGAAALRDRKTRTATLRYRRAATGEERWVGVRASPIFDEAGRVEMIVSLLHDVTELKHSEISQRLLAEAGRVLAGALNTVDRLVAVARLLVPQLADWCAVYVTRQGVAERVAVAHAGMAHASHSAADGQPLAEPAALDWDGTEPLVAQVMASGEPVLLPDLTDDKLRALAHDEAGWQALRTLGLRSALVVPLLVSGRTLGAITCVSAQSGRRYTPADQALCEELARRVALAVDNASLYEAERRARRSAEDAAEHTARLQVVTALLTASLTPKQVAEVAVEQSISLTRAAAGAVLLRDASGEALDLLHAAGFEPAAAKALGRLPLRAGSLAADAVRSGEVLLVSSAAEYAARYPHALNPPPNAALALPLLLEERPLGVLLLIYDEPRRLDRLERDMLVTLARQCTLALERTRLFEAERRAQSEARRLNAELEDRVIQRTAELRDANRLLERSQQHLRQFSSYLQSAREDERARIAREIHDEVGQQLTGLKMDMVWLMRRLEPGQRLLRDKLRDMASLLDVTVSSVRRISTDLRPGILDALGVLPAIDWQVQDFAEHTGLRCRLKTDLERLEVDPEAATALFRTLQAGLSNVARHAQATEVDVTVAEAEGRVVLQVRDNGVGLRPGDLEKPAAFGLLDMRERLRQLGGGLQIAGAPGSGATLTAYVPLQRPGAPAASAEPRSE